jgi:hypothetical protein
LLDDARDPPASIADVSRRVRQRRDRQREPLIRQRRPAQPVQRQVALVLVDHQPGDHVGGGK